MKCCLPLLALSSIVLASNLRAEPPAGNVTAEETTTEAPAPDLAKVSKAFGHMISQNLESIGLAFDMKEVMQGMQDCMNGHPSPMTEAECIQAISLIQDQAIQKQTKENRQKAEEFLTQNKTAPGVVEVDPGKLQYAILEQGSGIEVEENFSPVIRYSGKFLDGTFFGESREDEVITLEDTIEGLKKGIVGMKEGEKRRLFIHPDLGYGSPGFLPPSALLTFDIEVVKANTIKAEDTTISSTAPLDEHATELATAEIAPEKTI